MKLEEMYARALHGAEGEPKTVLSALRAALVRRGHERLLPKIFSEYKKLELGHERTLMHKKITPERERTRVLVELYRKLIAAK